MNATAALTSCLQPSFAPTVSWTEMVSHRSYLCVLPKPGCATRCWPKTRCTTSSKR